MQALWITVNGENALAYLPESTEELRDLLDKHSATVVCQDCERPVSTEDDTCPTCGEGLEMPEFLPNIKK